MFRTEFLVRRFFYVASRNTIHHRFCPVKKDILMGSRAGSTSMVCTVSTGPLFSGIKLCINLRKERATLSY